MNQNPKFMSVVCFLGLLNLLLFFFYPDIWLLFAIMLGISAAAAYKLFSKPLNVFSD